MKRGNLEGRLAKLEEAKQSAVLPNGGILIVEVRDGESEAEALGRALADPEVSALSASQRRRLKPVFVSTGDLCCL